LVLCSERKDFISTGLSLNPAQNEIGYNFPDPSRRLFWSLPSVFTGNKVSSYGGVLTITQRYSGSNSQPDQDVIIVGNGKTLYWSHYNSLIRPDESKVNVENISSCEGSNNLYDFQTFAVPLEESQWQSLGRSGPVQASRVDLMTALTNIELLLVRASLGSTTRASYLSDVTMDTAMDAIFFPGQDPAVQVEMCRCPAGYRGLSCEVGFIFMAHFIANIILNRANH
jgi:hypothetical protein